MDIQKEFSISTECRQQGKVLYAQKKFTEAIIYLDKAIQLERNNVDNYFGKGMALAALGRYEEAKETFCIAVKIEKKNPLCYFHIANVETVQGNIEVAIENYNKSIELGYEEDGHIFYNLALIYQQMDKKQEAISNYSKAIAREPLNPEFYLSKVDLYIRSEKHNEALQTLEELSHFCPDVFEGYEYRIHILCQLKRYSEAEEIVSIASKLYPKDVAFLIDRAKIMGLKGKDEEALRILESVKKIDGWERERRKLCFEIAKAYARKDNPTATITAMEEALLDEKEKEIDYEVRYFLATIFLSQQMPQKVLEHAEVLCKYLDINSYTRSAIYYKAWALEKLGKSELSQKAYEEAIRYYRLVSIQEPYNVDIYLLRAICLRDTKKYAEAVDILQYLLLMCPEMPEVHNALAQVYREMGEILKAEEAELKRDEFSGK